jgi:Ca2+-binding EF-hand superfamily protein
MTLKQFAKAIQAKSEFLATILFERMDKSASNTLSCDDFISSVSIIRYGSLNERLSFAFHLYDVDRSGSIEKADIVKMLRVSRRHNFLTTACCLFCRKLLRSVLPAVCRFVNVDRRQTTTAVSAACFSTASFIV